jgi:hypothetical protein
MCDVQNGPGEEKSQDTEKKISRRSVFVSIASFALVCSSVIMIIPSSSEENAASLSGAHDARPKLRSLLALQTRPGSRVEAEIPTKSPSSGEN